MNRHGFHFKTSDAEEFQERVSPMAGDIRVRPARNGHFNIAIRAAQLKKLNLFTVKAPSIRVHIPPPHPYFCLNIPLGSPFSITESHRQCGFSTGVHLLMPDRLMDLIANPDCRVLAVKFNDGHVFEYAFKLNGSTKPFVSATTNRQLDSLTGYNTLLRGLAQLWSDIQRDDASLASAVNLAEREDALFTQFVLAMQGTGTDRDGTPACTSAIAKAEDYLLACLTQPVSRAELAATSGVSIRTLSRGFAKRWGTGPMGFLKTRRIEAVYRELLGAEPGAISVTEVAYRYGFTHLGRFAAEYKRMFRESPSRTVQH